MIAGREIAEVLLIYGIPFAGAIWFLLQIADAQDFIRNGRPDLGEEGQSARDFAQGDGSHSNHRTGF